MKKLKYVVHIEDMDRFKTTFPGHDRLSTRGTSCYRVVELTGEEVIIFKLTWPDSFISRTDDLDI